MRKLLRLLIVFLNIVFLRLRISLSIIALFIIVIIRDLRKVFFRTFRPYFVKNYIDSSSKSTKVGVFLLIFFFLKPLYKLLSNLFRSFCAARKVCRLRFLGF